MKRQKKVPGINFDDPVAVQKAMKGIELSIISDCGGASAEIVKNIGNEIIKSHNISKD